MGLPRQSDNVRRINLGKGGAKPSRLRGDGPEARLQSGDERPMVVSLPGSGSQVRRTNRPAYNVFAVFIAVLSALSGALIAAVLLDSVF